MDENFPQILDTPCLGGFFSHCFQQLVSWMGDYFFHCFQNLVWMETQVVERTILLGHISNRKKRKYI
jgi:hypothetical protein